MRKPPPLPANAAPVDLLWDAVLRVDTQAVEAALAAGASVDANFPGNASTYPISPLLWAVSEGYAHLAHKLIKHGAQYPSSAARSVYENTFDTSVGEAPTVDALSQAMRQKDAQLFDALIPLAITGDYINGEAMADPLVSMGHEDGNYFYFSRLAALESSKTFGLQPAPEQCEALYRACEIIAKSFDISRARDKLPTVRIDSYHQLPGVHAPDEDIQTISFQYQKVRPVSEMQSVERTIDQDAVVLRLTRLAPDPFTFMQAVLSKSASRNPVVHGVKGLIHISSDERSMSRIISQLPDFTQQAELFFAMRDDNAKLVQELLQSGKPLVMPATRIKDPLTYAVAFSYDAVATALIATSQTVAHVDLLGIIERINDLRPDSQQSQDMVDRTISLIEQGAPVNLATHKKPLLMAAGSIEFTPKLLLALLDAHASTDFLGRHDADALEDRGMNQESIALIRAYHSRKILHDIIGGMESLAPSKSKP